MKVRFWGVRGSIPVPGHSTSRYGGNTSCVEVRPHGEPPIIIDAGEPGERAHTYRLGGMTCLAGDVIGDYSFDRRLEIGDKLVFLDMAHYTMVKTTTFNGVRLPAIATHDPATRQITVHRRFGYRDYRDRLS